MSPDQNFPNKPIVTLEKLFETKIFLISSFQAIFLTVVQSADRRITLNFLYIKANDAKLLLSDELCPPLNTEEFYESLFAGL